MFTKYQHTATVSRLSQTVSGWYNKSWYSATGTTYLGHLKALSIQDSIEITDFGKSFKFTTASTADIKESDRLTISGNEYDVKGVVICNWLSFDSLQCLITKLW